MLIDALGIDLSSSGSLWNVAIVVGAVCLIAGFLADELLSSNGFGIIGNGIIFVVGMGVTLYAIDHRWGAALDIGLTRALILATAAGSLLLLAAAAARRRLV